MHNILCKSSEAFQNKVFGILFSTEAPLPTATPQPFHSKTVFIHGFSSKIKRFSTFSVVESVENLLYSSFQSIVTHE